MIKRIYNSLAFRSLYFYKTCLVLFPPHKKKKKSEIDITLLILTGRAHTLMLQECLLSFYNSNTELPKLKIVSDGSIDKEALQEKMKWYPNTIDIIEKEECIDYHKQKERNELVRFARYNPMGLKMAAIIQSAEQLPTFYCDTDVLWFKSISSLLNESEIVNSTFMIKMSEDYQPAYDENMLHKYFSALLSSPYFCAGILFIKGNVLERNNLQSILAEAVMQSNHFTEQTIFAGINRSNGDAHWSNQQIACFQHDQLSLKPTFFKQQWIARHYVGPVRHLFWRDAFFLRLSHTR